MFRCKLRMPHGRALMTQCRTTFCLMLYRRSVPLEIRRDWEGKPESGSLPWTTLNAHLPLLSDDQLLANIQSQSQSHFCPTLDGLLGGLVKSLPDVLLLRACQAWSVILHPDPNIVCLKHHSHLHRLLIRRKFERIGQIITENLLDAITVSRDGQRALLWQIQDEKTGGVRCLVILHGLTDQLNQIAGGQKQLQFVFLNA